jgi:carbamoyltransferase
MVILGLNAFHGDSSAALISDGRLVAAVEEERFRRIKHWGGFPSNAIAYCLHEAGVSLRDVDHVAVNQDSRAHLLHKLLYLARQRPNPSLVVARLKNRRSRGGIGEPLAAAFPDQQFRGGLHNIEHHLAHLSSAFHVSPFDEAVVVSVDGFGDFASAAWGMGRGAKIEIGGRVYFPHSLGIFYQALTQYLGFPHYGDEYKVMGLAPYGQPRLMRAMHELVHLKPDGTYALDLSYFRHHKENVGFQWGGGAPEFADLFSPKLEANGKVRRMTPFRRVYVQSAAGDAGGAIGAAFALWHKLGGIRSFVMDHAYWGPNFAVEEVKQLLDSKHNEIGQAGCAVEPIDCEAELCRRTAAAVADGKVVGWFQGRMEWGPRALGNRSILCDPRRADMKTILNAKIKRRESFRPFAPSVLAEAVPDWFEEHDDVPFMMEVFQIREEKRQHIPAVTHVDGSGRLQTVHRQTNPLYHRLIENFRDLTGVPMVLNTSFNENEPVVCRPEEALDCFLRTKMDALVLGHMLVARPAKKKAAVNSESDEEQS